MAHVATLFACRCCVKHCILTATIIVLLLLHLSDSTWAVSRNEFRHFQGKMNAMTWALVSSSQEGDETTSVVSTEGNNVQDGTKMSKDLPSSLFSSSAPSSHGDLLDFSILATSPTAAQQVVVDTLIPKANGRVYNIVADRLVLGAIPSSSIAMVAANPAVERLEVAQQIVPTNGMGNLPGGVNARSEPIFYPPYTSANGNGAGVTVCIIDTGIDIHHPDFIDENGQTRVQFYWDVLDESDANPPTDVSPLGSEYNAVAIQNAIDNNLDLAADVHGHGSHVAGTAAGNGRALPGWPYQQYEFTGVAPMADLIVVKLLGSNDDPSPRGNNVNSVLAVDYCIRRANGPVSINMSFGSFATGRDGTSIDAIGMDHLAEQPGVLLFAAMGNAALSPLLGRAPTHGSGTIGPGQSSCISAQMQYAAEALDGAKNYLDIYIWYPPNTTIDVRIGMPDGKEYQSPSWRTGEITTTLQTESGAMLVSNLPSSPSYEYGQDSNIWASIFNADVKEGDYTICLDYVSGPGGVYHGWYNASQSMVITSMTYEGQPTDNVMSLTNPADARNVIAVGSYVARDNWFNKGGQNLGLPPSLNVLHDMSWYSSRGPTRDGRPKPEITAPGSIVGSSRSRDAPWPGAESFIAPGGQHIFLEGTSMATPHAAGVGALALAIDPTLKHDTFRDLLSTTSRVDTFVFNSASKSDPSTTTPNNDWGHGKLDATNLISFLIETQNLSAVPTPAPVEPPPVARAPSPPSPASSGLCGLLQGLL